MVLIIIILLTIADGSKINGGHKTEDRKSKAEEEKANHIFTTALQRIYKKDEPIEAKIAFVETLAESQRGQIFIAEHVFGKAPQTLDVNTELKGTVPIDEWIKKRS